MTIGAASTLEDTNKIISSSKTQINWTNFHGDDDYAIRFALRIFKLFQKPLGIYRIPDIQGHKIVNIDTSGFVSGHLDYRKKLYQLTKMIHLREN